MIYQRVSWFESNRDGKVSLTAQGPEVWPRWDDEEEDDDEHSCGRVINGLLFAIDALVRAVGGGGSAVGFLGLIRRRPGNTNERRLRPPTATAATTVTRFGRGASRYDVCIGEGKGFMEKQT